MKKIIYLAIALILFWNIAPAQQRTVNRQFDVKPNQKLRLDLKFGESIVIEAWDKNEVSFTADIEINRGKLNDALLLDFEDQPGRLRVTADYDKDKMKEGCAANCADSDYSSYNWSNNGNNHMVCSKITYKLLVPENMDIEVKSISGDIELLNITGPVKAKSISGFVDLSWPSGRPADINLKTISGEAYTDISGLQFTNKKDHIPLVGYTIRAKIDGGGPAVSLESVSGNIYLRESKAS